jgi:anti-anti-sigma factor
MAVEFETSVADEGSSCVVRAAGELDIASGPRLWDVLADVISRGRDEIVLDLERVTFIDSSGLSVILRAHKTMEDRGGKVALRSLQPQTRKLLELAGLTDVLHIEY